MLITIRIITNSPSPSADNVKFEVSPDGRLKDLLSFKDYILDSIIEGIEEIEYQPKATHLNPQ